MAESVDEAGQQNGHAEQQGPGRSVAVALGEHGVTVRSLEELWRFSNMISASDLAPKDYRGKPANVAVALEMGMELGLRPMQAIQSIAVINGRPAIWGDAMLALVEASGLLEDMDEGWEGEPGKDTLAAFCEVKRRSRSRPHRVTFSIADAKAAGLYGKDGPWKQYTKRMLQLRARGFALRDVFPDVLKGMIGAEEARDVIDITPQPERTEDPAPTPTTRSSGIVDRLAAAKGPTIQPEPEEKPAVKPEPAQATKPKQERTVEPIDATEGPGLLR